MKLKKQLSLLLCGALMVSALAGCGNGGSSSSASGSDSTSGSQSASTSAGDTSQSEAYVLPDFMVLSGPTGVGAAKLMADNEAAESYDKVAASSTVEADNQAVSSALINGDVDIAAVATNVAANLYNQSEGAVQVLAVNTLGVLYILEKGDTVTSMADLAGKTVYATGEGANPGVRSQLPAHRERGGPGRRGHPVDDRPGGHRPDGVLGGRHLHAPRPRRHRPDDPGLRRAAGPVPHR